MKAVLQLMAAALAKRYIVYFTFGDDKLAKDISQIHQLFVDQDLDVATVWSLLLRYHKEVVGQAKANRQTLRGGVELYDFIFRLYTNNSSSDEDSQYSQDLC